MDEHFFSVQILFWKVKVKKTWRIFVADRTLKKWKWKRPEECLLQIELGKLQLAFISDPVRAFANICKMIIFQWNMSEHRSIYLNMFLIWISFRSHTTYICLGLGTLRGLIHLFNLVPIPIVIFWMVNFFSYTKILKDTFNALGAEDTTTRDFFVSDGSTLSVNHVNP